MSESFNPELRESKSGGENPSRFFNREEKIRIGEQHERAIITDRDLRQYEKFLQIDASELRGKTILDLGSGEFQKFARQLERAVPDAKVVCLDASLARRHADFLLRESQRAQKADLVSALFTRLPFKDNSFDVVLSLYGTLYLTTPESKAANLKEIARILKLDGEARLYPYFDRPRDAFLDEMADACGVACEIIKRPRLLPAAHGKDHFSEAMGKTVSFGNEGMLVVRKLSQV